MLKGLIADKYYNHWMLLVFSFTVLVQSEISQDDIAKCKLALFKFGILTSELYGIEYASYNVHILQHLPFSVEGVGPVNIQLRISL